MAGVLELQTDKSRGYHFRLKAGNGEISATSESYTTKSGAQNIASVKANAAKSDTDDLK